MQFRVDPTPVRQTSLNLFYEFVTIFCAKIVFICATYPNTRTAIAAYLDKVLNYANDCVISERKEWNRIALLLCD